MPPVPLAAELLTPATVPLLQLKLAPGVALVGVYVKAVPLQTADGVKALLNTGMGFTVTVNVLTGPVHPLAVGVTVTVAVTGEVPLFVAVNAGIFPDPLVPKPTFALLVQLKVVPVTLLPKLMAAPAPLWQ